MMLNEWDAGMTPPGPEEINQSIASQPWILRTRLTFEAYATRCRNGGAEPTRAEWTQHLHLTDEELQLLNDLIEARRTDYCLDEIGPKFVIREFGNKARVGWFDDKGELVTMSFPEFGNAYIEKTVNVGVNDHGKPVFKPLTRHWLTHPLTRRYNRVEFKPGGETPKDVLNLWRGWPAGLEPGWMDTRLNSNGKAVPVTDGPFDGPEMPSDYCDIFLDHMRENICGGDEGVFLYLLGWMADAFWNAGPCDTAVVLKGSQGSGKTFWAERFMEFFGIHALTLDDPEQVLGNFNKHLINKSVIFADEAFFAGNRKHAAKLKTFITRPDIFVEPKGVDGFVAPKMFRLIMASNDDHVVSAEGDDRRNLVLNVDAGAHNQDHQFFAAMADEWRGGGRRALFRWLTGRWWGEQVGEGRFRMWKRPVTEGLNEQKDLSLPLPKMVIHRMLEEGEPPCAFESSGGTVFVPTRLLVEARRLEARDETALGEALRVLAGSGAVSTRRYFDRRQVRGFWLPPLDECRRRWEAHLARVVKWPSGVTTWAVELREADDSQPSCF